MHRVAPTHGIENRALTFQKGFRARSTRNHIRLSNSHPEEVFDRRTRKSNGQTDETDSIIKTGPDATPSSDSSYKPEEDFRGKERRLGLRVASSYPGVD